MFKGDQGEWGWCKSRDDTACYQLSLSIVVYALSVSRLLPPYMHVFALSRHTRFGGTLQVGGGNGLNARIVANPFKDRVDCVPQATRQKSKIGKTFTADGMSGDSQGSSQR